MLVNKRVAGWIVDQYFGLPPDNVFIHEAVTVEDTATEAEIAKEALIHCDRFLHFVEWANGPFIEEITE